MSNDTTKSTEDESKKYKPREQSVIEYQRNNFHERYVGASLCKFELGQLNAEKILKFMKDPKHFLVMIGSPGCGKTYFCAALTEWSLRFFNHRRYYKEETLLRNLRRGISDGHGDYLIALEYMVDDDFVILDDVASGINPDKITHRDLEFRREIFFSFLDYRYNTKKPTVITSNLTRQQFKDVYSERIASRLFAAENTIIELFGDDLDKRTKGM